MPIALVVIVIVVLLALVVAASSVRIAKEYERGVVFRLGRLIELRGPGLFLIIPFGVDRLTKVDLRVITLEVPPQEVITSDNVTVKVSAVIFFQVLDARAAITRVFNFVMATSQIAQTTLRAVLGQSSLDELLSSRDKINQTLKTIIDQQTEPWGIKVSAVEVKDAELAPTMVRALARQAEAEREKRAKIIATEGEFQAAQTLANAAQVISTQPAALALRYMQTLLDMGSNQNSTIVFPIPIELIRPLLAEPVPMKPLAAREPEPAAADEAVPAAAKTRA
jgi:regulator of protease activity HflC (stomatin/prohibitin superfamily)